MDSTIKISSSVNPPNPIPNANPPPTPSPAIKPLFPATKPPYRAVAPRLIREVLALPLPPPTPPPPTTTTSTDHPLDNHSESEEEERQQVRALSPSTAVSKRSKRESSAAALKEATVAAVVKMNQTSRQEQETKAAEEGRVGSASPSSSISRQPKIDVVLNKAALGFRLMEMVFCLISFSIMAADKTQGWAGDSFDRYKEYRFCLSITVIGFAYAGFQVFALAQIIKLPTRHYFDFSMDQIMAYLLMSASSSAATRTDNWVTNWGGDEFTKMATASISMSFLAFFAFACSALISGYNLCNP